MKILEKIIQFFTNYMSKLREEVSDVYMNGIKLETVFPDDLNYYEVLDEDYFTCDYETMKKVCKMIPSRIKVYDKDRWDCDDFAWQFRAICKELFPNLPIGYVHAETLGGLHALNCCVYEFKGEPRFAFIEPQSGAMYSKIQGTKAYLILI